MYLLIRLCQILVASFRFFCCNAQTLQLWLIGSVVVAFRLSCSGACGILVNLTRDHTHIPCIERRILNHWNQGSPKATSILKLLTSFPGGSVSKESACNVGELGSIPGLGRSHGGGNGNSLQYSSLENPHGQRGLMGYYPWHHTQLDVTERLSTALHSQHLVFHANQGNKTANKIVLLPENHNIIVKENGNSQGINFFLIYLSSLMPTAPHTEKTKLFSLLKDQDSNRQRCLPRWKLGSDLKYTALTPLQHFNNSQVWSMELQINKS